MCVMLLDGPVFPGKNARDSARQRLLTRAVIPQLTSFEGAG